MTTPRPTKMEKEVAQILSGNAGASLVNILDTQPSANATPGPSRVVANAGEVSVLSFTLKGATVSITTSGSEEPVRRADIEKLNEEIKRLKESVSALEAQLVAREEVIMLRAISREQAKGEIRELYSSGETLYYSDVAQRLRLDLRLIVELCQELEEEGALEIDANYVER